jgi:hypothetical protein
MTSTAARRRLLTPWQQQLDEQDGVLARRQALTGGMSEDQWQWRLSNGRWQPVLLGVAVAHTGLVTPRQRSWAAVLYAGRGAALAGDAALVELGMRMPGPLARVDVAVADRRTVAPRAFVGVVDQGVRAEDIVVGRVEPHSVSRLASFVHPARRLPTMRVAPAVLHAAAWASSDRAAEWRVAAAVQQRLVLP